MKLWLVVLVALVFVSVALAEPIIQVTGGPNVFVDSSNRVVGTVKLKNVGSSMPSKWLIEMQVVTQGQPPLAIIDPQSTCNPAYPNNVHVRYQLAANEETWITLLSTPGHGTYDVHLFSRTACGGSPTQPWNYYGTNKFGTVTVGSTTTTVTNPPPPPTTTIPSGGLQLVSKDVRVDGNTVVATVTIKNTGQSMATSNVLEMQVQNVGVPPQAIVSDQKTCDPNFPRNVHKQFQLASGETSTIELRVSGLEKGFYDVHLLSRSKCASDINNPNPWERTQPFPYSDLTRVEVLGGGGGSEPNYRVVCDAHLTWSVLGGTDLNGVNCFSDRKCGFLEGTKFTDDNGGSGYIEYSRVGGGIRQSVTLGLLNPERRYRTEFCTKQPSGTVTYVDERGFPDQTLQWSIS